MAEIAPFTHVDVAPRQFERRVRTHAVDGLDRALQVEERSDFNQAADGDHEQDADEQDYAVFFEDRVFVPK